MSQLSGEDKRLTLSLSKASQRGSYFYRHFETVLGRLMKQLRMRAMSLFLSNSPIISHRLFQRSKTCSLYREIQLRETSHVIRQHQQDGEGALCRDGIGPNLSTSKELQPGFSCWRMNKACLHR